MTGRSRSLKIARKGCGSSFLLFMPAAIARHELFWLLVVDLFKAVSGTSKSRDAGHDPCGACCPRRMADVEPLLALANHPAHTLGAGGGGPAPNPLPCYVLRTKTGNGWTSSQNARLGSFQMLSPALMIWARELFPARQPVLASPAPRAPTCGVASFHKLWSGWRCAAFCLLLA